MSLKVSLPRCFPPTPHLRRTSDPDLPPSRLRSLPGVDPPPLRAGCAAVCGERIVSGYALEGEGNPLRHLPPDRPAFREGCGLWQLREWVARSDPHAEVSAGAPGGNVLGRMLAEVIAELEAGWHPASVLVVPCRSFSAKLRQRAF